MEASEICTETYGNRSFKRMRKIAIPTQRAINSTLGRENNLDEVGQNEMQHSRGERKKNIKKNTYIRHGG